MNLKANILLVEDEEGLVLTLVDRLKNEGYTVSHESNGTKGWDRAIEGGFDLIILDIGLPGKTGLDICRDLRAHSIMTPVIMLTARGDTVDRIVGLRMGADDYLPKPFDMSELLARVEAILRRVYNNNNQHLADQKMASPERQIIEFPPFQLDRIRCVLMKSGSDIVLSAKEYRLLEFLVLHPSVLLTRDRLLDEVWGYDRSVSSRTVDVHVAWLRQKLEEDVQHPTRIETVRGLGYRFHP